MCKSDFIILNQSLKYQWYSVLINKVTDIQLILCLNVKALLNCAIFWNLYTGDVVN